MLRETVHPNLILEEYLRPKPPGAFRPIQPKSHVPRDPRLRQPVPWSSPGGARWAPAMSCVRFLDATGAVYLDTQESWAGIRRSPVGVGAVRGRAMQEADLVVVVGRKLDYQLGYGSPAVFPHARFIRIADCWEEVRENRRGEVELFASPAVALGSALAMEARGPPSDIDPCWTERARGAPAAFVRYADRCAVHRPARTASCTPTGSLPPLRRSSNPTRSRSPTGETS